MKLGLSPLVLCLAGVVASGCAATPDTGDDEAISEQELGAEEQSFADYEATDEELARAEVATSAEHTLTLYAIPAPKLVGLSWKRPGGLARRTLINNGLGLSRALGHAAVRVECGATNDAAAGHFQGSVVDTGDEFKHMVLREKAGLGVLFRTVAGELEGEHALQRTIDERYESGRIAFIKYAVSADTCHALLAYAKELERENVARRYGFVRPLYREGAGCSAFSMAFLELANLDEARFRDAWKFDVRVPMKLIGGLDNPGNRVTVVELFLTFRGWAREDEAHKRLIGWDPTLMYTSISGWAKRAARDGSFRVERRGRALGLVLDRRNVVPRAELANRTFWAGEPGAPRTYWGFGDP